MFLLRSNFEPPVDLEDFAEGVVVEKTFESGGVLVFTLTFSVSDRLSISGSVEAAGEYFPLVLEGCNGAFPPLTLSGGKSE